MGSKLSSWSIPDLMFMHLSAGSGDSYPVDEQFLRGLNNRMENIASILLSTESDHTHLFGVPLLDDFTGSGVSLPAESVFATIGRTDRYISAGQLSKRIRPLVMRAGYAVACPFVDLSTNSKRLSDLVLTEMKGHEFGVMVLAVPVPPAKVQKFQFEIEDMLDRNRSSGSKSSKIAVVEFSHHLERILAGLNFGLVLGAWLTGLYFFCPTAEGFSKLFCLIQEVFSHEQREYDLIRVEEDDDLMGHIEAFGLIKEFAERNVLYELTDYKYLSVINSKQLAWLI